MPVQQVSVTAWHMWNTHAASPHALCCSAAPTSHLHQQPQQVEGGERGLLVRGRQQRPGVGIVHSQLQGAGWGSAALGSDEAGMVATSVGMAGEEHEAWVKCCAGWDAVGARPAAHLCIVALKGRLVALLDRQVHRQLKHRPCEAGKGGRRASVGGEVEPWDAWRASTSWAVCTCSRSESTAAWQHFWQCSLDPPSTTQQGKCKQGKCEQPQQHRSKPPQAPAARRSLASTSCCCALALCSYTGGSAGSLVSSSCRGSTRGEASEEQHMAGGRTAAGSARHGGCAAALLAP